MRTNRKYKTHTKGEWIVDKMQFMLDNFKRAFPGSTRRFEKQWEEQQLGKCEYKHKPEMPKIDWSKPLVCNNPAVTDIEYEEHTFVAGAWRHVCKLTYKQGYTYYVMYDDYGCTAGNNAGTINVRNKREQVTRHYAISKFSGGDVVATADTEFDARQIATGKGYRISDLTFTSHTFTR